MIGGAVQRVKQFWRNTTSGVAKPQKWFVDLCRGIESDSGIPVNPRTAMNYSSVSQAVQVIAGDVAQLPLVLYRKTSEGREPAKNHHAYKLLKKRPNHYMTPSAFKMLLQSHALLQGNGYAAIVRDGLGRPTSLIPLLPDRVTAVMEDDRLFYVVQFLNGKTIAIPSEHVLHIKGYSQDGITGVGVVTRARQSIGLGLAAEKHGAVTFKNNARPSVILETTGRVTREAALQMMADWRAMHAGLDNAGSTAVLDNGTKANVLSLSNHDAEWLGLRQFQRVDIASWFNLPPHKLGDSSRVSYNSLEQENQSYISSSLMLWLVSWQEECDAKLLTEEERDSDVYYNEFNTSALLRGDQASRYAAYQIGIQSEFLSPNEVRERENMNRRKDPGGDQFRNPNTRSGNESQQSTSNDKGKQ